jgi:hypothetical protein
LKTNTTLAFLDIRDYFGDYQILDKSSDVALAATMENNKTLILEVHCYGNSEILKYNARNRAMKRIYDEAVFLCRLADRSLKDNLKGDAVFNNIDEYYKNLEADLRLEGTLRSEERHPSYRELEALRAKAQFRVEVLYSLAFRKAGEAQGYHPESALVDQIFDHQCYMPDLNDRIQWLASNNQVSKGIVDSFKRLYDALCNEPIDRNTKTFPIIARHFIIKEADKTLQNPCRTREDIANSFKELDPTLHKLPMSEALKAAIYGVIGAFGKAGEAQQQGYDPEPALINQILDHQSYMRELNDRIQRLERLASNNQVSQGIVDSFKSLHTALGNEPNNRNTKTFSIIARHFIDEADKTLNNPCRTLEDIANSFKELDLKLYGKPPMSEALKAAICGVIGALVGAALGIAVGAAVTAWGGGFGALPGAILGAVQGFSTGVSIGLGVGIGVGGILGGQLGFLSSKQNHKIYREKNKLTEEMNNAVNDLKSKLSESRCR